MKPLILTLSLCLIALIGFRKAYAQEQLSNSATSPSPYSLVLKAKESVVEAGRPIRLDITLQNTSDRPINIMNATKNPEEADMFFDIHVLDEQVRIPHDQETKLGRKSRTHKDDPGETTIYVGSEAPFQLKAHGTVKYEVKLNRKYDLKRPGKYVVQVETHFEGVSVKSNSITVRISKP